MAAIPAALVVSLGISAVTSCTDDRYDLTKDISVDFNVDVSLPVGNSEFIAIGDFLELDETDTKNPVMTDADGNYVIRLDGGDPVDIDVALPSFDFEGQTLKNIESGFYIDPRFVGMDPSDIQGNTMLEFQIKAQDSSDPQMDIEISAELPAEVVDLKCADVNSVIDYRFILESGSLTLKKGLQIIFPDFMTIEPTDKSKGSITVSGGNIATLSDDIVISKSTLMTSIEIRIVRIDLGRVPGHGITSDGNSRSLILNDHVTVKGSAGLDLKDFNPVPSMVRMKMNVDMKTLEVERIEAKLDISREFDPQSITLDEIPEFLAGDNIRLDFWNPVVWLDMDNSTPFTAELDADLRSITGKVENSYIHIGANGPAGNRTEPVILPVGKGRIYVSRQGTGQTADGETDIAVPALGGFLGTIPDTVKIDNITVSTDPEEFMDISLGTGSGNYSVQMQYGLNAPLAFGRELSLVYDTDIKGWNEAFSADGDKEEEDEKDGSLTVSLEKVELKFTMMNTIPLNVSLDAKPIDLDGNEIKSGISLSIEGSVDAATEQNPVYTPVKITLSATLDAIKSLDGIRLSASLTGSGKDGIEGLTLNEKHGIQLQNVSARVVGGASGTLSLYDSNNNLDE
ncbi:MAG: hypothetical protein NC115_09495 [Bacteroidales bacterium]|nr:hypothetical protein [Bacteroidales bacterium]